MDDNIWNIFESDDYLRQFICENSALNEDTVKIVSNSMAISEQLHKLTKGIQLLEKELNAQISLNYQHLISRGGEWMDKLEGTLRCMAEQASALANIADVQKQKLSIVFDELETQHSTAACLNETCDILRRVSRVKSAAIKLPGLQDSIKASALLREIGEICSEGDVSGISVLEKDSKLVASERNRLEMEARNVLADFSDGNEKQVKIAVRVLSNFKMLDRELKRLKANTVSDLEDNVKKRLSMQSLNSSNEPVKRGGGPGKVMGGTFPNVDVASFRLKLWRSFHALEDEICDKYKRMRILQTAIDEYTLIGEDQKEEEDWFCKTTSDILAKCVVIAAEGSAFIKQALEEEYPKLLTFYGSLNKRLAVSNKNGLIKSVTRDAFLFPLGDDLVKNFENAYLSRSLSRLLECVHNMFEENRVPSDDDVDDFVRSIGSELNASSIDETLTMTVAKNIGKSVKLFFIKMEQFVHLEGEASQLIDVPNAAQTLNKKAANSAYYLKRRIGRLLRSLSDKISLDTEREIWKVVENAADGLNESVMTPLKTSITEAVGDIILTMHKESFELGENEGTLSLYVKELATFVEAVCKTYLSEFDHKEMLGKCLAEIGVKCLQQLTINACLVRPMDAKGREKLRQDLIQVENAFHPLCDNLENFGEFYEIFKSLRNLVKCPDLDQVENFVHLGTVLPYSLAALHLFSRAPQEFLSPHQCCNWSVARIMEWLNNHECEKDRLELVSGALLRYQQTAAKEGKNPDNFPRIYFLVEKFLNEASAKI